MDGSILVAYASKHGSTAEVAEAVAEELRSHGVEAETREVGEVRTLEGYAGVVLGAPIYMARWHKEARRFLARHRVELERLPVAIFALGPLKDLDEDFAGARDQLNHALAQYPHMKPRSVAMFGGAVDPGRLRFPFNKMEAADIRDWEGIREWAAQLAETLALVPA